MRRKIYHVTPADGRWTVAREGARRPTRVINDKAVAIARAKRYARKGGLGQVIVHKTGGGIQTEYTYRK